MADIEGMTLNSAADSSTPAPAADTGIAPGGTETAPANTGQPADDPYADTSNLPWNNDPRFQQFLADRKEQETLRQQAAAAADYEPWKGLVDHMKNDGFQSFDDFQAKQAEINSQQAAATRISQDLQRKGAEIMERVNNGYVDPQTGETKYLDMATAERMFELEKSNAIAAHERSQQAQRLAAVELDTIAAKPEYAKMDREYVIAMHRANPGVPIAQIAKQSHDREVRREQDVIARYNTGKGLDLEATRQTPNSGGSGQGPAPKGVPTDPTEFIKYRDNLIRQNGGFGK